MWMCGMEGKLKLLTNDGKQVFWEVSGGQARNCRNNPKYEKWKKKLNKQKHEEIKLSLDVGIVLLFIISKWPIHVGEA